MAVLRGLDGLLGRLAWAIFDVCLDPTDRSVGYPLKPKLQVLLTEILKLRTPVLLAGVGLL